MVELALDKGVTNYDIPPIPSYELPFSSVAFHLLDYQKISLHKATINIQQDGILLQEKVI